VTWSVVADHCQRFIEELELSTIVNWISAAFAIVSSSSNHSHSWALLLHFVVASSVIVVPMGRHDGLKALWIQTKIFGELCHLVCLTDINEKSLRHITLWMNIVAVVIRVHWNDNEVEKTTILLSLHYDLISEKRYKNYKNEFNTYII